MADSSPLSFNVYLDGTGNSQLYDTHLGEETNVSRLYQADTSIKTDLSYNVPGVRNSYDAQYDRQDLSYQSEAIYLDGVGSQQNDSVGKIIEGATGLGLNTRVEEAYNAIVAFHNKYPGQEIEINLIGFSRGSAAARDLANKIIDEGIPVRDADFDPYVFSSDIEVEVTYLIPPDDPHINKLVIFDTVVSSGYPLSDTHIGTDVRIHPSVDSTSHLIAANEYRESFKLTSAIREGDNSNIQQTLFAGAHSQIGGGYANDILAAGPLGVAYNSLEQAGVNLAPLDLQDRINLQLYNEVIEQPAMVEQLLIDSRIKQDGTTFTGEPDQDHAFQLVPEQGRQFTDELGNNLHLPQPMQVAVDFMDATRDVLGIDNDNLKIDSDIVADTQLRIDNLNDTLVNSRPSAEYIESLDLQPVEITP